MMETSVLPEKLLPLAKRLTITAQVTGTALHVCLVVSRWGQPGLWILFAMFGAAAVGNLVIATVVMRRVGHNRAEDARAVFNVCVHGVIGVVCGWSLLAWLFVPFVISVTNIPPVDHRWIRITAMLVALNALALVTGGHLADAVVMSSISVFVHVIIAAYLSVADNLLRESVRMMQELQVAQQLAIAHEKLASIGQLAAGVAHEINNPMCFITANVGDLLEELRAAAALPPGLVEYRDSILPETVDGIARVNTIVDDLRRFARAEPEPFVEFELSREVTTAVRMARTQLRAGQELHVAPMAAVRVRGLPRQMGQVILNLIVNALQSLDDQGEVWVEMSDHGDLVEVSVTDNGAGMTRETMEKLFRPFFTTKPPGKGLGLGLAVVHGIVTSHGGRIEVESSVGRGSRFRLRLPRVPGAAVTAVEPALPGDALAVATR